MKLNIAGFLNVYFHKINIRIISKLNSSHSELCHWPINFLFTFNCILFSVFYNLCNMRNYFPQYLIIKQTLRNNSIKNHNKAIWIESLRIQPKIIFTSILIVFSSMYFRSSLFCCNICMYFFRYYLMHKLWARNITHFCT